ncbi:MAG: branched-chain amino acid ABC transporter permease [Clostridia bacterium]|nr:branched-chain amino acid ABC transporter permease [Clostridia bacterium]
MLGFFVVALILPQVITSDYVKRLLVVSLMFSGLSLSFNLITGFMGQLSMAHCAFFGIGAYVVAFFTKRFFQIGTIPALLLAMVVAGIFGLILALPTLRLKGFYLAIATIGFSEIVRLVMTNERKLTNGLAGILSIPKPSFFGLKIKTQTDFYYMVLVLVILVTFVIYSIVNSRMGRAVLAIREDDVAAEAMGIHIFKYKAMIFIISTMMAGLFGGFYAMNLSYIDPTAFTQEISMRIMSMTLLGGLGSLPGSFIGAFALSILPEITRALSTYRYLFYGIVIVLVMLFKPAGLMGNYNFKYMRQSICAARSKKTNSGKEV